MSADARVRSGRREADPAHPQLLPWPPHPRPASPTGSCPESQAFADLDSPLSLVSIMMDLAFL